MSKGRLVITAVLTGQSQSQVGCTYGVSQGLIRKLMVRYRLEGVRVRGAVTGACHTPHHRRERAAGEILRDLTIDPRKDYQPRNPPKK